MAEKRLFQEYKQLQRTPARISNPQIAELAPVDAEESIFKWRATIVKRSRHDSLFYYNGRWELDITVPLQYPRKPPLISFSPESKINHPNINLDTGEICLDILKDELWSPAWNLEHLVGAVLMLLDEPEPDSPLNVDLANLFRSDKLAFESAVQHTMWKYNTLLDATRRESGEKSSADAVPDGSDEEEDEDEYPPKKLTDSRRNGHGPESNSKLLESESMKYDNRTKDSAAGSQDKNETLECTEEEPKSSSHVFRVRNEHPLTLEDVSTTPAKDFNYIYDIGRHITQEFIKKATEVTAPRHQLHQLAAVHQLVSNNVARQIEQICLKHPSRTHSPTERMTEKHLDVSFAEESFLEKIDQQVDEIRRLQERQSLS